MSASQTTEEKQKLSRNYRGWRPNRSYSSKRTKNNNQNETKQVSSRNRWHSNKENQYSEEEKITRKTTAIFSKLTPESKNRLLPQIIDIYKGIDNEKKLERFLSVIFQSAIVVNGDIFHKTYVNILVRLLHTKNNEITNVSESEFKQCVLQLCDNNFKTSLDKSNAVFGDFDTFNYYGDIQWYEIQRKRSLLSISQFLGKLTAKRIVDFEMSLNYLNMLFGDEKKVYVNNIEAICCIFTELYPFIHHNHARIALKNADMDTINVTMKSHLLVYGYTDCHYNNMPVCIVNFCIGYYDIDCYLFKYYQKLQKIGSDYNYGVRIKMLIENIGINHITQ